MTKPLTVQRIHIVHPSGYVSCITYDPAEKSALEKHLADNPGSYTRTFTIRLRQPKEVK